MSVCKYQENHLKAKEQLQLKNCPYRHPETAQHFPSAAWTCPRKLQPFHKQCQPHSHFPVGFKSNKKIQTGSMKENCQKGTPPFCVFFSFLELTGKLQQPQCSRYTCIYIYIHMYKKEIYVYREKYVYWEKQLYTCTLCILYIYIYKYHVHFLHIYIWSCFAHSFNGLHLFTNTRFQKDAVARRKTWN